jgi:amino acid adenylation domain-containing protein
VQAEAVHAQRTAVVGMAARLPGAACWSDFWPVLAGGTSQIRDVTPARWDAARFYDPDPAAEGKANSRWGGLLDRVDTFDHRFFGISAREARSMDPQQRLLLEEAWHCIEDAGLPPRRLKDRVTAVYVGVMTIDYHQNVTSPATLTDSYACLGNYAGILANRVSHFFGWRGESFALDAACAGSLTALHRARRALLAGECDYALVAGVSLILNPWHYVSFAKSRMLSPDGQCRTFDRDANGYVPGEGVVTLLLCREEDALAEGARIHGLLLGSATGHVGGGGSITAPSVASQRRIIEAAARDAAVPLASVSYVEAHGTGTPLGDPIEIAALAAAFGARDGAAPVHVGSVKTNIGHLEAAAGLAGVTKLLLMMRHRIIPPVCNLAGENPLIDFAAAGFAVPRASLPWDAPVLRAGVSAFGFGGTGAHAILQEPDTAPEPGVPEPATPQLPFLLSARTPEALAALWQAWRDFLAKPESAALSPADIAATLACGRSALECRVAIPATDRASLAAVLAGPPPAVTPAAPPRLLLRVAGGWSAAACAELAAALPGLAAPLARIAAGEPAAGMADLFARLGIAPSVIDAADAPAERVRADRARGILHLPWALDAPYLAALRDGLGAVDDAAVTRLATRARALRTSNFTFRTYLDEWQRALGPHVPLADWLDAVPPGASDRRLLTLAAFAALWRLSARWQLPPPADAPGPAWAELAALLGAGLMEPSEAAGLTGGGADPAILAANVAARAVAAGGIEPGPLLAAHSAERGATLAEQPSGCLAVSAADGPRGEDAALHLDLSAPPETALTGLLAALWQRGADVDWSALGIAYRPVSLPLYPFEPHRHWIPLVEAEPEPLPEPARTWRAEGVIAAHRIGGEVLLPAAAWIAATAAALGGTCRLERVGIHRATPLGGPVRAEWRGGNDGFAWLIDGARICAGRVAPPIALPPIAPQPAGTPCDVADAYAALARRGYAYGPALRVIVAAARDAAHFVADLASDAPAAERAVALIDGAAQAILMAAATMPGLGENLLLPYRIAAIDIAGALPARCRAVVPLASIRADETGFVADVRLTEAEGRVLLAASGWRFARRTEAVAAEPLKLRAPVWQAATLAPAASRRVLLIEPPAGLAPLFPGARAAPFGAAAEISGEIDTVAICVPAGLAAMLPDAAGARRCEAALGSLLDLLRALAAQPAPPRIALITQGLHAVRTGEAPGAPFPAALVGAARAAACEVPAFALASIDLPANPTAQDLGALAAADWPAGAFALRDGVWHRRMLAPCAEGPPADLPARPVIVIAGGSGGIARRLARHLAGTRQARIALLSRSADAAALADDIAAIEAAGGAAVACAADLADAVAVAAAFDAVRARWGRIDLVVNAAMRLADRALAGLGAAELAVSLAPKLAGSINLAAALARDPGARLLCFSSALAWRGNAGQANYVAGCAFQDAFMTWLAHRGQAAQSIDWGFWGESGRVANDFHRQRIRASGLVPHGDAEALAAFDAALGRAEPVLLAARLDASWDEAFAAPDARTPAEDTALDAFAVHHAFLALERAGALTPLGLGFERERIARRCVRLPSLRPLLDAALDALARHGLVALDGPLVRARAERNAVAARAAALRATLDATGLAPVADIVEACASALPAVLDGAVPAGDLLFPGGDTARIEALLHDIPAARNADAALAAAVAASVAARPGRVRVLEAGAGTGAATRAILRALAPFADRVEYLCTDISAALLGEARRRLAGASPAPSFAPLDIARATQGDDAPGRFDIVIAANTLHALAEVAPGLAHLRARLLPGGELILREPAPSDALALTLGLRAAWWARDAARRQPGALQPPDLWRALLRDGFETVRTGEVLQARRAGASVETAMPETPPAVPTDLLAVIREVIAATVETRADGIDEAARFADLGLDSPAAGEAARRLSARLGRALASHIFNDHPTPALLARHLAAGLAPTRMAPAVTAPPAVAAPAAAVSGGVAAIIREVVATSVETRAESIDETARFADLGLDSILSGEAARRLSARLGRTLPPAVFNDHPTVAALARHLGGALPAPAASSAPAQTEIWAVATPGDLASLAARAMPRRAPGPGEVEVAVEAAALNFRDVMEALGRLGETPRPLGLEFAGRVAAVGPGVASFAPGDAVVGLSIGSLARHVTVPACLLAAKPAHLSFAEAAGLPIVFLTAIAAIEEIARLQPGQSVLIHAGTGGVGLAALQVARAAGATVYATAGSEEKRAFLRRLGVACVGDSRSASFAGTVRAATGGAGVDMVLNCLAGPLTDAGLELVKPGGVFVEIGKTDLRDPAEVAARYNGVRYTVYDLLGPIAEAPEATGRALAALMPRFSAGGFTPLPVRGFRFAEAAEALRFLARARHVGKVVLSDAPVAQAVAPLVTAPPAVADFADPAGGFAIVGMAGRFPGAPDLAAFWRLLREGRDAIGSVPEGRWRAAEFGAVAPTAQLRAGGFLDDAECFDAAFFGIAPREAVLMDPQSRVMLETAWQALADAGLDAGMGDPARAGVFVGASASDYAQKAALLGLAPDKPTLLAQMPSTIAARISYLLDIKGPALAVDLGCASAIAAVKLACDALASGEVDVALAGAVAVQSTPLLAIAAAEAEILAPDGRCRAFAADAQGLGLSEGAGAVVLKRLPDALAAGDAIHAVIRGAAVSQNGATNGLTAPSVAAQVALARRVLAASGVPADSISCIEAHGVGTKAGDAAEIAALAEWLGDRPVPVGSAKGNIGHSLAAAGMAGLLKTVLQLRHREIAPSLHLEAGRNAAFGGIGLQPVTQVAPWHADGVRRAAVNAFAINGGNGFLLVEEAPARAAPAVTGPRLLVVAARDEAALHRRLGDLAMWIDAAAPDFAGLAAALAGAPAGFAWRAVFVAADTATFRAQIDAARAGGAARAWRIGQAPRGQAETRAVLGELVRQILAEPSPSEARLLAAAQLVADGADAAPAVRRASGALLPPYPFARTRYWLGEQPASVSAAAPVNADTRLSRLRAAVASVLRMAPEAVASDVPLPRLGLDSLLAFELRAGLMQAFGAAPDVASLLGDATLAELAAALPEVAAAPAVPALRADAAARFEPFPLTDIQLAYWLGRNEDFALGGPCHVYWEFESDAAVDVARLEAALNRVIAAQDMLRAVILPDGTQRVLREVPRYTIGVHDWRLAEKPEAELAALRARIGDERFDPARWPLFHVALSLAPGGVTRLHLGIDLLIIDVPSLVLLLGEWGRLYREPSAEPARPAIAFRDYVQHQRRADIAASAAYWAEVAPTLPPAPRLPEMKPLDARRNWAWVRHGARLDAAAWRRFRAAARAAGVTPVAALVAALAETLAHWAAEPRFTLNLTVNDREPVHPDVARVIGDFTGTVLLGFDLGQPTGFAERARASGATLARHLDHARFSGVKVLQQRSAAAGAPELMPVVFTSMLGHGALEGPLPRLAHGLTQTPQVWLDVQAMEQGEELLVTWDAIDALFPDLLIDGMFGTWHAALRHLADEASWDAPLGAWIAEAERARRARRNATDHPVEEALLHEPFLARALAEPDRTAIIDPDRTLTYGALLAHAAAVAAALDDAAPDRLTAVAMPKGWPQIAAAIGVLMAGGAYLPVDPELPASRLQHLLARGEVRTVLTLSTVEAAWPAEVRRVAVDTLAPAPVHAMPERRATPRDLAYVIFTSGSTGEPKGVMIEHRAALNTVRDVNARYDVGAADRVLALSSLSFDLSVYDIFGLLAAGGAIVLPRPRSQGDPAHLADLVALHRVSIWNSVPMFAQLFLEGDPPAAAFASLRLVMMSGDWIPPDLPGRLGARNPALRLVSLGGATEASIWSIAWDIGPRDPRWSSVPYGWPMRNQRFHVLDEAMNHCPDYVPGELCIAGEGLARGYWRDAARTAERFVTHPATGERLYRTGDLGRYREDGVIEFLGRRDGQVKIGGYRIELGEIEAALQRIPGVRQAAVVARGEAGARRSLAAFYVAADASPDIATVRASLAAALPAYMVPPEIHRLAALPLNANEKVDRKALAALSADAVQATTMPEAEPDAPPVPSAAELESVLLGIWREVLDNQFLPPEAKLFEHGAHSFHAVEANARINRAIGGGCTVTDIFEFATVRGLAAGLAARAAARAPIRIVTAPPLAEAPVTQRRADRRRQFRAAAGVAAE